MADNFYASYPVTGGGVSSLNGLTGALTLVGGTGVTITPVGTTITIDATGTGANKALSNLTATAINQDLTPNASDTFNLGTLANSWASAFIEQVILNDGAGVQTGVLNNLSSNLTLANTQQGTPLTLTTATMTASGTAGDLILQPGDSANLLITDKAGSTYVKGGNSNTNGNGGDVYLQPGLGDNQNGRVIVSGNIDFALPTTYNIGSPTNPASSIYATGLYDSTGNIALNIPNRILYNSAGTAMINVSGVSIDVQGKEVVNAADPTTAQSLVTRSFLTTTVGAYIPLTQKAANNGVATLDAGGKIPAAQLPNTVMEFKGIWDASTNTPTLADGTGNTGDVYLVTVAGTQNLGSGPITFAVGDWVVYNGTIWQKSINSNAVVSVNGQQGVVVINAINQLTGDATAGPASGSASAALTLATVNSNVGSFGSASQVGLFTVNGKGLITAASTQSIQISEAQVTNLVSDLAGKQATGNYITALTGDATASGPGSAALTLSTVNSNVGSFGTAANVSTFTVNAKGLITAASNTAIQITEAQVTNLTTDLAGKQATGNYITALTGDATASGPGSAALTLATVNSNVGTFGSATQTVTLTVNAKGLITAASQQSIAIPFSQVSGTVPIAQGGTGQTTANAGFNALSPMTTGGDLIYGGASGIGTRLANGTAGQVLTSAGGTAAPTWAGATVITASPSIQTFISGTSQTYSKNYTFIITSGNATVGATYTNNSITYTVYATVASATQVVMRGTGAPTSSGTLTKATGTGDATLTFSQVLAPLYLKVRMVGGGAGGGGNSTGAVGTPGGSTTFGNLTAGGGTGGAISLNGGAGGTSTIGAGWIGSTFTGTTGSTGNVATVTFSPSGGGGGSSIFGGGGPAGSGTVSGGNAVTNSGSGGGGAGGTGAGPTNASGGGGSGGFIDAISTFPPSATYTYSIGGGGGGGGGTYSGGAGGAGYIEVTEYYQ